MMKKKNRIGGVQLYSLLQLFSCCHEESDSMITLQASKFTGNVVIVEIEPDSLMLLNYSHPACAISIEWMLKYDTRNYQSIDKICK